MRGSVARALRAPTSNSDVRSVSTSKLGRGFGSGSSSKMRNIRTEVDGIVFSSKREARRYSELKLLERAGEIRALELQHAYGLYVNGVKVCSYRADFDYLQKDGAPVTEDAKGFRTPLYRLKAKMFAAYYGRSIVEV